jgi:hypothetical protein
VRFLFPPEEGADDLNPNRQRRRHGRGHRPCHIGTLTLGPPGAQSPRPAPAPPLAGASRPPGRALASVGAGGTGPGGSVPRGRGKRSAFPFPARRGVSFDCALRDRSGQGATEDVPPSPLALAGAIAPATAPRFPMPAGGPKPPASARPALGGRFPPAGSGAGLCRCGWQGSWGQRSAPAGETHAFPGPAPRGNPFPRVGKSFPAGRRSDCCFSALLVS